MKKSLFYFLLFLIAGTKSITLSATQSLFIGTIQFPNTIKQVPSIRIYYGGHKITGEPNNRTKQFIFSIPEMGASKKFHIVITRQVEFEMADESNNTVKYIKVSPEKSYKCCKVEQVENTDSTAAAAKHSATENNPKKSTQKTTYSWRITKLSLDENGQLPDNTIVICYPPEYIENVVGGSRADLPRILVKQDLLSIVGSENQLHEEETELLLSALNSDALHTKISQEVKSQDKKTIIACKTCI